MLERIPWVYECLVSELDAEQQSREVEEKNDGEDEESSSQVCESEHPNFFFLLPAAAP